MRFEIFGEKQLRAFEDDLLECLGEFSEWCASDGTRRTYRNRTACVARRFACDYLDLCATGAAAGYRKDGRLFEELED